MERVWLPVADLLGSRAGAQARARKGLLGLEAHGILAPLKLDEHPAHTQTTEVLYNLKDFTKLVASSFLIGATAGTEAASSRFQRGGWAVLETADFSS